jgi:hypothetical protein
MRTATLRRAEMVEDKVNSLVDQIRTGAEQAGTDPDKLLEVINQGAAVVDASDLVRDELRFLLERAFLAGIDPTALYNKPYTPAYVLRVYNDLRETHPELPERKPGRRPRIPR